MLSFIDAALYDYYLSEIYSPSRNSSHFIGRRFQQNIIEAENPSSRVQYKHITKYRDHTYTYLFSLDTFCDTAVF